MRSTGGLAEGRVHTGVGKLHGRLGSLALHSSAHQSCCPACTQSRAPAPSRCGWHHGTVQSRSSPERSISCRGSSLLIIVRCSRRDRRSERGPGGRCGGGCSRDQGNNCRRSCRPGGCAGRCRCDAAWPADGGSAGSIQSRPGHELDHWCSHSASLLSLRLAMRRARAPSSSRRPSHCLRAYRVV